MGSLLYTYVFVFLDQLITAVPLVALANCPCPQYFIAILADARYISHKAASFVLP